MGEREPQGRLGVAVEGLDLRYRPGASLILHGLTRRFAPGALTVVTGPSGSGKSTLMYILGLLLSPTAGRVLYDGREVSGLSDGERAAVRARHVGFVFQDAVLDLSRTGLGNIEEAGWLAGLDGRETRRRGHELLERFGVGDRSSHRPGEISGGQAQRIALCRALAKRPALLLADEPTGNLDQDSADVVWRALAEEAAKGATVVVATHEAPRAASADEHLRVGDG